MSGKGEGDQAPCPRVAVIYHFFPHYRAAIVEELAQSDRYRFEFWGSLEPVDGIVPYCPSVSAPVHSLTYRKRRFLRHRIRGYSAPLLDRNIAALIILANPNMIDTWIMALVGRLVGKKILFWAHGWLRMEPWWKRVLRNIYFRLSHQVLTYDERAKALAGKSGFPVDRINPIFNSLDWGAAKLVRRDIESRDRLKGNKNVSNDGGSPALVCTARLIPECRFDILLDAMKILCGRNLITHLTLVGDGPMRAALERQAAMLGLSVNFVGAVYGEGAIGPLIYAADITVSPGKVGLTAIHSMMYGTPVITHGDRNAQMPEVEAVTAGETGAFFKRDDPADLALKIENWLRSHKDRDSVRRKCWEMIEKRYNPVTQCALIENALGKVLGKV
jgi:glycosyltransferase involved in cell wall biosynthesis